MIFDITVNDNDFTYVLKTYFDLIHNFEYCLKDYFKTKLEDNLDNYAKWRKIEETMRDCHILLNVDFKKLTIAEKNLLEHELKQNLICWIKKENVFGDSNKYVEENLKVKISNKYEAKWQNGEHLWVYIKPYRTVFAVVQ